MIRKKSHFQDKEPILEELLQFIRFQRVFPYINSRSKVLDVGCGYNGAMLSAISSKIYEGMGIDVSVSKKTIANNIKLSSQRSAKLQKNYFDLATCLAVVEHLEKPIALLKIAYKSLKKNGKLIITTPSPIAKPILEFLAFRLGIVSKQEIKDHKKYYSKDELISLLVSCGFKQKCIEVKSFSFGMNTFAIAKK